MHSLTSVTVPPTTPVWVVFLLTVAVLVSLFLGVRGWIHIGEELRRIQLIGRYRLVLLDRIDQYLRSRVRQAQSMEDLEAVERLMPQLWAAFDAVTYATMGERPYLPLPTYYADSLLAQHISLEES